MQKSNKHSRDESKNVPSWTHVGHVGHGFLSAGEAAVRLGIAAKTVTRWCETGKLPAVPKPYGQKIQWMVSASSLEAFIHAQELRHSETQKAKRTEKPHAGFVDAWVKALQHGGLKGKVYSARTIEDYRYYVEGFFARYTRLSMRDVERALMSIPADRFATREHCFKALMCFGRYLQTHDAIETETLEKIGGLKPKRHTPPQRTTVREGDLQSVVLACKTQEELALVLLLSSTGLRASELCGLTLGDIDMAHGVLTVKCGKGGKERRLGLSSDVTKALQGYLGDRQNGQAHQPVFLNRLGQKMDRHGLGKRLERIGKTAGVTVTPHSLRRAFVTINANKGRPLQMLQMACGHSDIRVTMGYCRTSEEEVIAAMKDW